MKIHFLGAVREVTGSRHLLEAGGISVLLDCGLFQGHRQETRQKNETFSFLPREVEAVILSHAHIDHSGNIPTLVKQGFEGDIYSTFATRDLSVAMLRDSAKIQEKDAEFLNTKRGENIKPLYTMAEAEMAMEGFSGFNYHKPFEVTPNISVQFYEAGHILGAALSVLTVKEKGKVIKIGYLVDLGRKNLPILRDPEFVRGLDYIIIESTYGNRFHQDISGVVEELAEAVRRTYDRKGKIIIPAFALERTQELVYYLHKLYLGKAIPKMPIYVDSPLAVNITEIFRLHPECFDKEINETMAREDDPFGFSGLEYVRDVEKSRSLNDDPRPAIIISASGMCENGRILHHLKNNIEDERNTILIVGFMARHTLGRRMAEKEKEVFIFNRPYQLKAEVVIMDSFSAHADRGDILNYLTEAAKGVKGVFFVHGEEDQALPLAELVKEKLGLKTFVPEPGEAVEL